MDHSHCGVSVGTTKFTDLVFDNIAVILADIEGYGDVSQGQDQSTDSGWSQIVSPRTIEEHCYIGKFDIPWHSSSEHQWVIKKFYGRLTFQCYGLSSAWVYAFVDICAEDQRIRPQKALLYGCETWTLYNNLQRQIDAFNNKCLWGIMGYQCVKQMTSPWNWFNIYYLYSLSMLTRHYRHQVDPADPLFSIREP